MQPTLLPFIMHHVYMSLHDTVTHCDNNSGLTNVLLESSAIILQVQKEMLHIPKQPNEKKKQLKN